MKNTFISKVVMIVLGFLMTGAFLSCSSDKKNHIMVLDTSMSMIGYGGKNILGNVKTGIENYIDKVEDGDTITFMTFASNVQVFPTVTVSDKNDRDILKKYITRVKADGKWTYTMRMMNKVFETADLLERNNGRQTVIAIMTDGLDDPPPGYRKYNFKKLVSKYQGKSWWIYIISFSDFKNRSELAKNRLKGLRKIAKKTTIIAGGKDPKDAIDKKLPGDMKDHEARTKSNALLYVLILLLVAAVVAAVIIWMKRFKAGKVEGYLQYWNNELLDPTVEVFDLGQRMSAEVIVGNSLGCHLNLREFDVTAPFVIKTTREGGLEIKAGSGDYQVEFANKEQTSELNDGDIFKVNNFTFKYSLSGE